MEQKQQVKYTQPEKIDWNSVNLEHEIDWDNIDFLTFEWDNDKKILTIFREEYIPQMGGLKPILAYKQNFVRLVEEFQGGKELIKNTDEKMLFDIALAIARGAKIPLQTGAIQ